MAYQVRQSELINASNPGADSAFIRALFTTSVYSSEAGLEYPDYSQNERSLNNLLTLNSLLVPNASLTDRWNNIRIPKIEELELIQHEVAEFYNMSWEAYQAEWPEEFQDGWIWTADGRSTIYSMIPPYASLIGVPIRIDNSNLSFISANLSTTVEASYHNFYCQDWLNLTLQSEGLSSTNVPIANETRPTLVGWMSANYRTLQVGYQPELDKSPYTDALNSLVRPNRDSGFFIDTTRPFAADNSTLYDVDKRQIVFGTIVEGDTLAITTCFSNVTYVELFINCNYDVYAGLKCQAEKIRRLPTPPLSTNFTAFERNATGSTGLKLFRNLTTDPNEYDTLDSTFIEKWLWDPPSTVLAKPVNDGTAKLNTLPIDLFSKRLGLLWNTFFHATVYPSIVVGDALNVTEHSGLQVVVHQAEGPASGFQQYIVNWRWMAMYFVTVAIMILASILTVLLRFLSKGPDILGYVSTLLRDSPFMEEQAARGSTLTGLERARLLENHRVRLLDVQADQEVGRIAIAQIGPDGNLVAGPQGEVSQVAAIHRGRLYE